MLHANYNLPFLLLKCRIFTYCSAVLITDSYSLCLKIWVVHSIRPRLQLMYSSFRLWNPHYIDKMSWVNKTWLSEAIEQAKQGLSEGGLPIGSVLVDPQSGEVIVNLCHRFIGFDCINLAKVLKLQVVSRGYNRRVQDGDPTAHAEMVCFRNAGRRTDWHRLVLVSTLRFWYWLGTNIWIAFLKRIEWSELDDEWAHNIFQSLWDVYWNIHSLQSAAHYRGGELELQGQPFSISGQFWIIAS